MNNNNNNNGTYDKRINVQVGEFTTSNSDDVSSLDHNQMKEYFIELMKRNNELAKKNGEEELIIDEEKHPRRL